MQSQVRELLRGLNKEVVNGIAFERILDRLFDSLASIVPFDRIGIALVSEDGKSIRLFWVRSNLESNHLPKQYEAPLQGSSLVDVLNSRRPRIINDLVEYERTHQFSVSTKLALRDGIRSSLTLPLILEGKGAGFVFFSSGRANQYKQKHVAILSEVSDEISIIVEHGFRAVRQKAEREREQKVKTMLHDLRSPLSIFMGSIKLLSSEFKDKASDPDIKKIFDILAGNSDYMMNLINEVSDLRQLQERRQDIETRDVPLEQFVDSLVHQGEALAKSNQMRFELHEESKLPKTVKINEHLIRRAIENFLSNGFKYAAAGTTVVLGVSSVGESIKFSVTDHGPGIPSNEMSKLFTEYGKTSVTPKIGQRSSGLGLAIAKAVVEAHGGSVGVESREGFGSCFWFHLPHHGLTKKRSEG